MRGWKKIFHANRNDKKAGRIICMPCKGDFKTKSVIIEKEEHYIMMKASIQE